LRSIVLLLAATALIGGCDRPSAPKGQANDSAALPTLEEAANMASAPVSSATPDSGVDVIGKLVRDHKGEAAPTAGFTGPDGKPLTLAAFSGKPVLLNLWATWCVPCVEEMPDLKAIDEAFGAELVVMGISLDDMIPDAKRDKVAGFLDRQRIAFPNVYYTGNPDALGDYLKFSGEIPITIVYDRSGKELWRVPGRIDRQKTIARLREQLRRMQ